MNNNVSFGNELRVLRRKCRDPLRGGLLTQERLGELIGMEMGDAGYSSSAVSDWERSKSRIHADDRQLLVALTKVLRDCGGITSVSEADALLRTGNYRGLDASERQFVFPELTPITEIVAADSLSVSAVGHEAAVPLATPFLEPLAGPVAIRDRTLQIMLDKVRSFWIDGVLAQATQGSVLLDVAAFRQDDLIEHPWRNELGVTMYAGPAELEPASIMAAFLDSDRALLICGEPGSGKTISLLVLARDLVAQADADAEAPVPVVLTLASWAETKLPLQEWVVEELSNKYRIPRRTGREWIQREQLILLLDGLEDVATSERKNCARAIDEFRRGHGLMGIVVCSRLEEYRQAALRLNLGGAVILEPLTASQVNRYLVAAGASQDGLREALSVNKHLSRIVSSPLMLKVMSVSYRDQSAERILSVGNQDASEQLLMDQLFDAYTLQMFARQGKRTSYSEKQVTSGLSWIARSMETHNKSLLLVEQLQPSWLPAGLWRWRYMLLTRSIEALSIGFTIWILMRQLRYLVPEEFAPPLTFSDFTHLPGFISELPILLMGNVLLGLLVGTLEALIFNNSQDEDLPRRAGGRPGWKHVGSIGFVVALATLVATLPFESTFLSLTLTVSESLAFMLLVFYAHGWNYQSDIRPIEALGWSWSPALIGLLLGTLVAVIAEIVESLFVGYNGFVSNLVTMALGGFMLGGLQGRRIETTTRPNQGMYLSMYNATIAACAGGSVVAMAALILSDATAAVYSGLLMASIVIFLFGGANIPKHYLIRWFISRRGNVPLDIVPFLDNAASLVFLRKVGGAYMFVHGLLEEHFARMYQEQ